MMSESKPVCVVGASGRMGQRVLRLLAAAPDLHLASVLVHRDSKHPPLEHVLQSSDADVAVAAAKVVIDFSAPPACGELAAVCARQNVAYVVASTGLEEAHQNAMNAAAKLIPLLQAANLSLGVNVLMELVELAAARLFGFDIEINEIHHRHKRDAPSGTALALGQAATAGRPGLHAVLGRQGVGEPRQAQELGYSVARGGDVAGEHTVFYFGEGERLELTHRATTGDIFAHGALHAARWLLVQPPGRYSMRDALR